MDSDAGAGARRAAAGCMTLPAPGWFCAPPLVGRAIFKAGGTLGSLSRRSENFPSWRSSSVATRVGELEHPLTDFWGSLVGDGAGAGLEGAGITPPWELAMSPAGEWVAVPRGAARRGAERAGGRWQGCCWHVSGPRLLSQMRDCCWGHAGDGEVPGSCHGHVSLCPSAASLPPLVRGPSAGACSRFHPQSCFSAQTRAGVSPVSPVR